MSPVRHELDRTGSESAERFSISDLKIEEHKRGGAGARWARWLIALVVLAGIAAGTVVVLRNRPNLVEAAAVRGATSDRPTLLNASGYVTPRRRATVAAKITGLLESINVDEGMRVESGQELARLDDTDARVRLQSAQADIQATQASLADLQVNLENAERELERSDQLHRSGVTSAQALDTARTAVDSIRARIASVKEQVGAAEARARIAQQDLDNTIIRAPFAGMVVSKDAQRGEMVSPISAGGGFTRTGIATIVDMTSLEIEVDVNESYIARVRPGQPVTAVLDAYPDWSVPGKVRTIIPTADRQKATVKVRVTFDRLDPRILPDMGVKVAFLGNKPSSPASGTVLIPREAVRGGKDAPFVFVNRQGRAERRPVTLGEPRDGDQQVLSGLSAGEQVLINAPETLRDGQPIQLKQ